MLGWAGFQRGRVDRAPWLAPPPPPPKAQLTGPQNPTDTDPRAPEVARTRNWAKKKKKENGIFWNQRVEGVQKSHHLQCFWWGEKLTIFKGQKKFSVPLAPDFIITD